MGWSEYGLSKMPLKLVLIFMAAVIVNTMIIESFRVLLLFDYGKSPDTTQLTEQIPRYEGFTVLDSYLDDDESRPPWENSFTVYLLEGPDGSRELAVVENHVLFTRHRYLEDLSIPVPEDSQTQVYGHNSPSAHYSCVLAPDGTIESAHVYADRALGTPILLVIMLIVEYVAFIWLFRRDEIQ